MALNVIRDMCVNLNIDKRFELERFFGLLFAIIHYPYLPVGVRDDVLEMVWGKLGGGGCRS